jgi:hypothetical protein
LLFDSSRGIDVNEIKNFIGGMKVADAVIREKLNIRNAKLFGIMLGYP